MHELEIPLVIHNAEAKLAPADFQFNRDLGALGVRMTGRWRYAAAAVFMQVLLGVIYSWSIFPRPSRATARMVESANHCALPILATRLRRRHGPGRIVAGPQGPTNRRQRRRTANWNRLSARKFHRGYRTRPSCSQYGIVAGFGVGLRVRDAHRDMHQVVSRYKRGMIGGLAVMGFGLGPLLFGPLLEALIGSDPTQFAVTIPRTFSHIERRVLHRCNRSRAVVPRASSGLEATKLDSVHRRQRRSNRSRAAPDFGRPGSSTRSGSSTSWERP